jgi:hypothetical protein
LDLHNPTEQQKETKPYLVSCRNFEEFEKVVRIVQELPEKISMSARLKPESIYFRQRRRK